MSELCDDEDVALVPLSMGAQRLGMSWASAWRLVLTGRLKGQKVRGRWMLTEASLTNVAAQLAADRERGRRFANEAQARFRLPRA